jgi:DNA-binding winged helix-turn-helix (wHTH) protein
VYRFGKCRYETRRLILYRDDEEVTELQLLHRNLLTHFLEHPKTVILRETLREVCWGQTVVDKDALNRAISELRSLLGSPGRNSLYIKTIDGVGYEFIADITIEEDNTEAGSAAPEASPAPNQANENEAEITWLLNGQGTRF